MRTRRSEGTRGFGAVACALLSAALFGGCGAGEEISRPPSVSAQPVGEARVDDTPREPARPIRDAAAHVALPPDKADDRRPPRDQRETQPQPIFRPSDTRAVHDDAKLAELGIRAYSSRRLKLYTDIDPELAAKIPPLIDAAYPAWEAYFGKLPPNRERTEFQITGYLMADSRLFREAGLIPAGLRPFDNGRHRGAEFWMYDQKFDYYRRHLAIHESTHCFMEAIAGERYYEALPVWYWEGMAELFGTHRIGDDGRVRFRVMPDDRRDFAGFGRIKFIRDAAGAGQGKSLRDVAGMSASDFLRDDAYAWSWALCKWLDTHPVYRKQFRRLGSLLTGSRFVAAWRAFVTEHQNRLPTEWALFVDDIEHGYDIERAAIDFRPGEPLDDTSLPTPAEIQADRGWQSSAVRVERGQRYEINASGQFSVAQQPRPWISEAGGISFDYFNGRPLGLLLARIRPDHNLMLPEFEIGQRHEFTAPASGTLYFRLNDAWSRLADNRGRVTVRIRRVK